MRIPGFLLIAATLLAYSSDGSASEPVAGPARFVAEVPGDSNLWLAGMPDGTLAGGGGDTAPSHAPYGIRGFWEGAVFSFSTVGAVSHGVNIPPCGPEGRTITTSRKPGSENGIATIVAPIGSLIGVFLDDTTPGSRELPVRLRFKTQEERDFQRLAPALQQPFFIGDGKTSFGEIQQFVAPAGATRLYLGTMDTFGWFNNAGSFSVTVIVRRN